MRGNKLLEIIYSLIRKYLCPTHRIKWPEARKLSPAITQWIAASGLCYWAETWWWLVTVKGFPFYRAVNNFHNTSMLSILLGSMAWKPRRQDRKSMENSIPNVITPIKSPIPQTYYFHCVLMIFKIDQSKQKEEALKHLWNIFPPKPLSSYKYVVGKNKGKPYLWQKPTCKRFQIQMAVINIERC